METSGCKEDLVSAVATDMNQHFSPNLMSQSDFEQLLDDFLAVNTKAVTPLDDESEGNSEINPFDCIVFEGNGFTDNFTTNYDFTADVGVYGNGHYEDVDSCSSHSYDCDKAGSVAQSSLNHIIHPNVMDHLFPGSMTSPVLELPSKPSQVPCNERFIDVGQLSNCYPTTPEVSTCLGGNQHSAVKTSNLPGDSNYIHCDMFFPPKDHSSEGYCRFQDMSLSATTNKDAIEDELKAVETRSFLQILECDQPSYELGVSIATLIGDLSSESDLPPTHTNSIQNNVNHMSPIFSSNNNHLESYQCNTLCDMQSLTMVQFPKCTMHDTYPEGTNGVTPYLGKLTVSSASLPHSNTYPCQEDQQCHSLLPGGSTCSISAELSDRETWEAFSQVGTEMIVTKRGRRMFPVLRVKLSGMLPSNNYAVYLTMEPADNFRYRYVYHSSHWVAAGVSDLSAPAVSYVHPRSPSRGQQWMEQEVTFDKVKLSNCHALRKGQIVLQSMQRYTPRLHVVQVPATWRQSHLHNIQALQATRCAVSISLPNTSFITVTAYQNHQITKLKIARNPFAKGFRSTATRRHKRAVIAENDKYISSNSEEDSESGDDLPGMFQDEDKVVVPGSDLPVPEVFHLAPNTYRLARRKTGHNH